MKTTDRAPRVLSNLPPSVSLPTASDPATLREFIWDKDRRIRVHPRYESFAYSDGAEVEARLRNILEQTQDRSLFSRELRAQITDWVTEYHFSEQRHNLLRHLPFRPSDRILELGAGCGAITRQLGESGAQVTAIEGGLTRAECIALRCAELPNVNVYCSDFRKINFTETYDYVLLIGVLEYSPIFFGGDDPFGACLKLARGALKPDGLLVIAIENRLGLKYFVGRSEDHVGQPYFGIQDLYTDQTAKTLGKEEMRALLERCRFEDVEFQYPFPDYKLPGMVFTEQAFHAPGFAPGEIIRQFASRDYTRATPAAFSEKLAWPQIAANGLAGALANSFLVFASRTPRPSDAPISPPGVLGSVYTLERKPAFKTETRFGVGEDGHVQVSKRRLMPDAPTDIETVTHFLEVAPYAAGQHLESEMLKKLMQQNEAGFLDDCRAWRAYVQAYGLAEGAENTADPGKSLILPEFFDCIPRNLITQEGQMEYIDREWGYNLPCPLNVLIVRGLFSFLGSNLEYVAARDTTLGTLLTNWLAALDIPLDASLMREFVAIESRFAEAVQGNGAVIPGHIERHLRWSKANTTGKPRFSVRLKGWLRRKAKALLGR